MSRKLELAVLDAKKDLSPAKEPDWDAIAAKLFAQIDADDVSGESSRVARLGAPSRSRGWSLAAGGLAMAAAVAMYVGHKSGGAPLDQAANAAAPLTASALVRGPLVGGEGNVLIGGARASAGASLHVGEALETRHTTAYLERAGVGEGAPPLVAWSVEDESRISVVKATGALVVALERGSIEAQVTPVPSGEAFAIDVPGADGSVTRVAVHGTHLRVMRVVAAGDPKQVKLVVDLSEGVVSIGAPPRAGSTYGALVTAPAHVELDTSDPSSLVVSHRPEDVRTPVDLVAASASSQTTAAVTSPAPVALAPAHPSPPQASPPRPAPAPRLPAPDANAEATVTAAVKACMSGRTKTPDDQVTVTVSSSLELRLHDDGTVDLARFSPPLPPDVQLCAANAIYKTRFPRAGTLTIDLKF